MRSVIERWIAGVRFLENPPIFHPLHKLHRPSTLFVLPPHSLLAAQSDTLLRFRFLSSRSSTGITARIVDPTDIRLPACLERGPKDLWARAQRAWTS
ncbi:unnamed protein product [Closterium sp. Naga37s-1]|nr:unnamed protein product [Closterium sp. Naga37s-1]